MYIGTAYQPPRCFMSDNFYDKIGTWKAMWNMVQIYKRQTTAHLKYTHYARTSSKVNCRSGRWNPPRANSEWCVFAWKSHSFGKWIVWHNTQLTINQMYKRSKTTADIQQITINATPDITGHKPRMGLPSGPGPSLLITWNTPLKLLSMMQNAPVTA